MLRSLGMTRGQVTMMILAEAAMLGIMGAVLGLLVGLFLSRVIMVGVSAVQGYSISAGVPVQAMLIGTVIALVVSQLAAIWPARRASGLRIIEAIQFE